MHFPLMGFIWIAMGIIGIKKWSAISDQQDQFC